MKISVIIPVYNQEELVIRAIDSVPTDCELIVVDDGSDDDTWSNLLKAREERGFILLYNETNQGVAAAVNKGLDAATGDYVVLLGSDDYFITENFVKAAEQIDGEDMVYFDLEVNSGDIWKLTPKTKSIFCGATKFMKREFIGDTRAPEDVRIGSDWFFYIDLEKKNPTDKFTGIVVTHYNFPRENSLRWLASKKGGTNAIN